MNFSWRNLENNNAAKRTLTNKVTTLNPDAAEFVPSAVRSSYSNKSLDANRVDQKGASGKVVLDPSESNVSCNSDDEAHQYWRCQLPDDITPDFKVMGEVELPGPKQLSLSGLSIHDGIETSRFSGTLIPGQTRSPLGTGSLNLNVNLVYPSSSSTEDQSYNTSLTSVLKSWDKKFIDGNQHTSRMGGHHYDGNSNASFLDNLAGDQALIEEATINPLVFLTSQYPRFSAERLAEVYCANECNLNSTIATLHQLELQADGSFSQTSELFGTPRRSVSDFSSMPVVEAQNGLSTDARDFQQTSSMHRSSSSISRGSSRTSQLFTSSFDGHGKLHYGGKSRSFGAARAAPVLPETEEAVENMYSGSRGEVRDIAVLRNACLDQASQAYLIGNKALSRALQEKGHLYNMQMKAALLKAGDTVYPQRSPSSPELYGHIRSGQEQERVIDLHNLHINEALLVLEHELSVLRSTARYSGQCSRAVIRVSGGVRAEGTSYIPQRLPMAVEQFLFAEGLHCTQPQPGLLHVVIY